MQLWNASILMTAGFTWAQLWTKRSYGQSLREWAARIVNARQSRHMSVIFAVSNQNELFRHSFKEGGYKHEYFNALLQDCPAATQNRPAVFIFDNAPSHARAAHAQLQPQHITMFQPAYSPFFNLSVSAYSFGKAVSSVQWQKCEIMSNTLR